MPDELQAHWVYFYIVKFDLKKSNVMQYSVVLGYKIGLT